MQNRSNEAKELLAAQLHNWTLAASNYAGLNEVQVKSFDFDACEIKVQFNPARIVSSAAKVDKQSIEQRKCFLCAENRPAEQTQVDLEKYWLLVNPFPIFPQHFTIPEKTHCPQLIGGRLGEMLEIAAALPDFTLFYNGPKCGASAPDHFHFQAGNKGFMPLEGELEKLKNTHGQLLPGLQSNSWSINDGVRRFLLLEGLDKAKLVADFELIYAELEKFATTDEEEPMMNILCCFAASGWQLVIFPRYRHRPSHYFEEGEKNILLSPASVDLGGVLITPLEKDFSKITKADIADILNQVLWPESQFMELISQLSN